MKKLFCRWLSALLILLLALSPVALAEEATAEVESTDEILDEQAAEVEPEGEAPDEQPAEAEPAEDVPDEQAVGVEPVDEFPDEQDVDIAEDIPDGDPLFAAELSEELSLDEVEIPIDAAHFPDAVFLGYVKEKFDLDESGSLSPSEIAAATQISIGEQEDVHDFTGIKYFTSLVDFSIMSKNNPVKSLDLSGMTSLKKFYWGGSPTVMGQSAALNVSGCTSLTQFQTWRIALTSLNASGCTGLAGLEYDKDRVSALDLSGCTGLKTLACQGDLMSIAALKSLNVSGCTNLTSLDCGYSHLSSLNLKGCTRLTRLHCDYAELPVLDVRDCAGLTELNCTHDRLTSLNVSGFSKLQDLGCGNNQLTSLNISGCTSLRILICADNKLTGTLNLSGYPKLECIMCYGNQLSSLNLSGCAKLFQVSCNDNQLTSLNVGNCPVLRILYCTKNSLASLDLSGSPLLTSILVSKYGGYLSDRGYYEYFDGSRGINIHFDTTTKVFTGATTVGGGAAITAAKAKTKATVNVGSTYQIDAAGATAKGFKSSNKKVATVTSAGLVTPKKAGKVKITFKAGKKKRTVTLTVKDPTIPKAIALNLSGTVAAQVGVPQTLTVTLPAGTVSGIKWKSSNKKVATVKNGVVTFKKAGKVTITATATRGKKKAKVKFKVSK